MFENVGKKIMDYVTVITVIGFVGSVILGLFLMTSIPGAGAVPGLIVMVVGCLLSWINGVILYGFGRLIYNSEQLNELQRMKKTMEALNANVYYLIQIQSNGAQGKAAQEFSVNPGTAPVQQPQEGKTVAEAFGIQLSDEIFSFPTREEGEIFCPNCGTKQKGNRDKCWECSAKFVYEDEQ